MPADIIPLTKLDIPDIYPAQLSRFTPDSIHVKPVTAFSPDQCFRQLAAAEGRCVIGADFGGDKGLTRIYRVEHGKLIVQNDYQDRVQSDGGAGYLESLKKTAHYAEAHDLPVGFSWGGPLDGNKLLFHPKADVFIKDLEREFANDLSKISPSFKTILNDGPAGLISGAMAAYRLSLAKSVLFTINGGGLNSSILKDGTIYSTEAGHVEAITELNIYNQTTPCGVFGAQYTCIERLGANKAGIEAQWQQRTGEDLSAKEIEERYKAGDEFARELYDHSALVTAHQIIGAAQALEVDLTDKTTTIVGHGGAYKFPYYGPRITQIIEKHLGAEVKFILTKEYSEDACAEGAAIAALTAS